MLTRITAWPCIYDSSYRYMLRCVIQHTKFTICILISLVFKYKSQLKENPKMLDILPPEISTKKIVDEPTLKQFSSSEVAQRNIAPQELSKQCGTS